MQNPWRRLPAKLKLSIKIAAIALLTVGILDFAYVIGFSMFRPNVPAGVDAVIVLGAKVGTPALTQRTLTGLLYYQQGKTTTLVLSGGKGPNEPISEAQAMDNVIKAAVAKTHGTMPHIVLETKSTDTMQNLGNSHALVPKAHRVVIVSDDYHLARSVAIAKHVGFKTVYWNAPKPSYYSDLDLAHYFVREAVAMIVYAPQLL